MKAKQKSWEVEQKSKDFLSGLTNTIIILPSSNYGILICVFTWPSIYVTFIEDCRLVVKCMQYRTVQQIFGGMYSDTFLSFWIEGTEPN